MSRHDGSPVARWIDLGDVEPRRLHASYAGLALAQGPEAAPIVVWGRADRAHICLGQSQYAEAELDLVACAAAGVPVLQRPLGGGTVLVDGDQYCFFLIVPRAWPQARPAQIFAYGLKPVVATYQALGLAAEIAGRSDIWHAGTKIAGSGAASLGQSLVLGGSFVLRFPHALFARLVRAPSPGFRDWLAQALPHGFKAWESWGPAPSADRLRAGFRAGIGSELGWTLSDSAPDAAERAAIDEALVELDQLETVGERRLVRNGIKLNAGSYLTEDEGDGGWLRVLTEDGRVARVAAGDVAINRALQACVGLRPEAAVLARALAGGLPPDPAGRWARRLAEAAVSGDPSLDDQGREPAGRTV